MFALVPSPAHTATVTWTFRWCGCHGHRHGIGLSHMAKAKSHQINRLGSFTKQPEILSTSNDQHLLFIPHVDMTQLQSSPVKFKFSKCCTALLEQFLLHSHYVTSKCISTTTDEFFPAAILAARTPSLFGFLAFLFLFFFSILQQTTLTDLQPLLLPNL